MYVATLADILEAIRPQADYLLFDAACLSRIRSIAERLPSRISDFMGFERVLGFDDPGVDYAVGLSDYGMNWLISSGPWPDLRRALSDISPHVGPTSPRPWLEFDTRRDDAIFIDPSLHVGLDPILEASSSSATLRVMQALAREWRSPDGRVLECIDAIPGSSTRLFIGAMYSRCSTGVRINVAGISAAELLEYLEVIRWPGDLKAMKATLETLAAPDRRFGVQINVATDVGLWLGIELMLNEPYPGLDANSGDLQLLDSLCATKRCTRDEQNALLRWPARIESVAPFVDRYIDARSPKPGQRLRHGTLVTALHHYKLTFEPDGSIETKVYFGVYIELG